MGQRRPSSAPPHSPSSGLMLMTGPCSKTPQGHTAPVRHAVSLFCKNIYRGPEQWGLCFETSPPHQGALVPQPLSSEAGNFGPTASPGTLSPGWRVRAERHARKVPPSPRLPDSTFCTKGASWYMLCGATSFHVSLPISEPDLITGPFPPRLRGLQRIKLAKWIKACCRHM